MYGHFMTERKEANEKGMTARRKESAQEKKGMRGGTIAAWDYSRRMNFGTFNHHPP